MKYSVRVWTAQHGDAVPLTYVAQAMARHAASGFGHFSIHGQTLVEMRPEFEAQLFDAANKGKLKVCDSLGRVASASEIIAAAAIPKDSRVDLVLGHLYAKTKHLLEWGAENGDDFEFVETPGKMSQYDLASASGEVLEGDYYRGTVGGGESERFVEQAPPSPVGKKWTDEDPQRRLRRLRDLGGSARYVNGDWKFKGFTALVDTEKSQGCKRCDPKTIRADLKAAAQAEKEEKKSW